MALICQPATNVTQDLLNDVIQKLERSTRLVPELRQLDYLDRVRRNLTCHVLYRRTEGSAAEVI